MKLLNFGKIVALGLLAPSLVFAQATSTLNLALEGKMISSIGNDDAKINVLGEMLKQYPNLKTSGNLEVSMVKIDSYAGVGGSQIFLSVNNKVVDGVVVDNAEYKTFELKNIERSQMTEASLILQTVSKIKVKNIQIVLGAPAEPAIFGHYADKQAAQIGGGAVDNQAQYDEKNETSQEQITGVYERYYGQVNDPNATVVDPLATVITPTPVTQAPVSSGGGSGSAAQNCLLTTRGPILCIGATVSNSYNGQGIVSMIQPMQDGKHLVNVSYNNGRNGFEGLGSLNILDPGAYNYSGSKTAASCVMNSRQQNLCIGDFVLYSSANQNVTITEITTYRNQSFVKVRNSYNQVGSLTPNNLEALASNGRSNVGQGGNYQPQANNGYQQAPVNNGGYATQAPVQNTRPVDYKRDCVTDKRSNTMFCIGDQVSGSNKRGSIIGTIISVRKKLGKDTADIRSDSSGRVETYKVDELRKR